MKTLKIIIIILLSGNYFTNTVYSCGWYEDEESYRISAFRAEISELLGYRSFYYTPKLLNSFIPAINNTDRYKNIEEWQKLLNGKCRLEDAFTLLYKVKPDLFMLAYQHKTLNEAFEGNTFIELLTKPENKQWLEYFAFAKKNEFNNQYIGDPWKEKYGYEIGTISHELIQTAKSKLLNSKNKNLQERYAYHLIRLYRQTDQNEKCIETFNNYFKDSENMSVLKTWSLLHKAEALNAVGKKVEANYLFSKIFNLGEEKRVRAYRFFSKDLLNETLKLAKNKEEIAGIWAIMAIKNPGPAFKEIKLVVKNAPHHPSIPILIMREINKLEDWIFTPELTSHSPSLHSDEDFNEWEDNYEKIKEKNRAKDLNYLKEINNWIRINYKVFDPQIADYIKLARAHLHLIARENNSAITLFNSISKNAPRVIHIQKNIELSLFYAFENKLTDQKVQTKLAQTLTELEKITQLNHVYGKPLYSLATIVSKAFVKENNIPFAGLLKLKAERYKDAYEDFGHNHWSIEKWHDQNYYWKIAFFDRYASVADMNQLINLIEKRKKNKFEQYLCKQNLATKNALLDLKGTIALRMGDLKATNNAFSGIPIDYWKNNYEFSTYLDENPFITNYFKTDTLPFKFNKALIIKELVALEKEATSNPSKTVANYIKIGNFFYNASYWGNSWMMLSYIWTSNPNGYSFSFRYDILFNKLLKTADNFENSFYKCSIALKYYNKALGFAKNKEQLAMIYFMKHCCEYNQYQWREEQSERNNFDEKFSHESLKQLYANYKETTTFKQIRCSLLDDFAGK